ncbi:MAG: MBL fold metallo-hydrolase, partial [Candidatus Thorarchaeota archaeon]|nr:MBL fold metallo-hydrolase [Candidatus Thorarchaeota archaeon]
HVVIGGAFPFCNTIVVLSDEVAVIDPGCRFEDLRNFLKVQNKEIRDIDYVILSHIHPDHITHAVKIQRLSKCRIVANEITAPLFDDKEKMKNFLGFHPEHKVRPFWEKLVNEKMFGCLDEGHVDISLRDATELSVGDVTLRTFYTPGHLPDHMCIVFPESDLIFGADIDCTEFGPYYGHPNSSIPEFRESIHLLKSMEFEGLISGHLKAPLVSEYISALKSYELQIDMREDFVLLAISGGAGVIDEITKNPIIYRSLSNLVFLQFEKWMIEHHVSSLLAKELIRCDGDRFVPTQT